MSPAYCVFRPEEGVNPWYLHYLYRTPLFTGIFKTVSTGVVDSRLRLYPDVFFRLPSLLPPPDEQAAIARYLDHADARIRRYIHAKRRLIALLNEEKQAIIQHAVTRGLDPAVPLKPSGVDWMGDIPEHWEVMRAKFVYREINSRSDTGQETHLSMSQKLGLVPSSMIEERRLVSESFVGAKICETGDLVLNRLKAHLGVFALASERGLVSPDYTVLRPTQALCSRYFELLFRTPACRVELRQKVKGIVEGFWRLYTDDFYNISVPVPPQEEQSAIIEHLDIELSMINQAINSAQREIDLMREYRTRLIADVVTGKIDVRAAAAALPATMEFPAEDDAEPMDDREEMGEDEAM